MLKLKCANTFQILYSSRQLSIQVYVQRSKVFLSFQGSYLAKRSSTPLSYFRCYQKYSHMLCGYIGQTLRQPFSPKIHHKFSHFLEQEKNQIRFRNNRVKSSITKVGKGIGRDKRKLQKIHFLLSRVLCVSSSESDRSKRM